jgi:hypothetical protein
VEAIGRLATPTDSLGNPMTCSIIAGDLNLPYVDWNGNAECVSRGQPFINRLIWESGYTLVVNSSTTGDALMDVYLVWPESLLTSCSTEQEISDHCGVLLEVGWEENYYRPQENWKIVRKTNNIRNKREFSEYTMLP